MSIRVTSKTIQRTFPLADLSGLPTTNPGGGKPWLSGGFLGVGNFALNGAAVIAALGYTPSNKAGDTFTGNITAPGFYLPTNGQGLSSGDLYLQGPSFSRVRLQSASLFYSPVSGNLSLLNDNGVLVQNAAGNAYTPVVASSFKLDPSTVQTNIFKKDGRAINIVAEGNGSGLYIDGWGQQMVFNGNTGFDIKGYANVGWAPLNSGNTTIYGTATVKSADGVSTYASFTSTSGGRLTTQEVHVGSNQGGVVLTGSGNGANHISGGNGNNGSGILNFKGIWLTSGASNSGDTPIERVSAGVVGFYANTAKSAYGTVQADKFSATDGTLYANLELNSGYPRFNTNRQSFQVLGSGFLATYSNAYTSYRIGSNDVLYFDGLTNKSMASSGFASRNGDNTAYAPVQAASLTNPGGAVDISPSNALYALRVANNGFYPQLGNTVDLGYPGATADFKFRDLNISRNANIDGDVVARDIVTRSIGFSSASGNQGDIGWHSTTLDRWSSTRKMTYIGGTLYQDCLSNQVQFPISGVVLGNYAGAGAVPLTITAAGSMLSLARSGLNNTTLGEYSGTSFAIRNGGDSSLMMTINNSTKQAEFFGITRFRPYSEYYDNIGTFAGYIGNGNSLLTSGASAASDLAIRAAGKFGVSVGGSVAPSLVINGSGFVGLNVASPNTQLDVAGAGYYTAQFIGNGGSAGGVYVQAGKLPGTDPVLAVYSNSGNTHVMSALANGNVTIGGDLTIKPSASRTPANNGELTVEATSNTTLTFKLKGSDGTVRSGTITLS